MKVSRNYLKQYLDFDLPDIDKLADVIGLRLGALEEPPINLGDLYKSVLVVKVVSCTPIEDSDHLNLCLVDDGKKFEDVERSSDGLIEVVCGAPNARAGIMAAWLPPGSIVPSTYHNEPLTLEKRPIRGHLSNGMLASPRELALYDDHEGILILDQGNPGDSFSKIYELDDYILDIENKMFTHRPDCFGLLGVAREVSGILNHKFTSPNWYQKPDDLKPETQELTIAVQNEIPSQVPRFSVVVIDNIEVKQSPLAVKTYLTRMGIRPINNIVDLTNLTMLETGQPLHAYDYNKLKSLSGNGDVTITTRYPRSSESLKLLSGKEIAPTDKTICISVGDQLVGLGGVMGGQNSEVDDKTTAVVLESACFDMYDIRRTSMELGIFSEAVTRFTKGQSPLQTVRVLTYAANKLKSLLPESRIASEVADDNHLSDAARERDSIHPPITIAAAYINDRLGVNLSSQQISELLTNVECQVALEGDNLSVSAPFWRTDIELREDVVEEVGRLFGYENIELKPLIRPVSATPRNRHLESKSEVRHLLASAGANELLTYSFVSKRLIENAGQSIDQAFEIANSLSPELGYYRLSLTPSLLSKVHPNIKLGLASFAIFEIGSGHQKGHFSENEPDLPAEHPTLALIYTSDESASIAPYFKAREFLDYLLDALNIRDVSFEPLNKVTLEGSLAETAKPYDKNRSALITSEGKQWGVIGEFQEQVKSAFKMPGYSAGFEVDSQLFLMDQKDQVYKPLSKYPAVKQDITLKVADGPSFAELNSLLQSKLKSLVPEQSQYSFVPISIFKSEGSSGFTNYSFHLELANEQRTMTDDEVNAILDKLALSAKDKFQAERI